MTIVVIARTAAGAQSRRVVVVAAVVIVIVLCVSLSLAILFTFHSSILEPDLDLTRG